MNCHVMDDARLIAAKHPSGDDFDLGEPRGRKEERRKHLPRKLLPLLHGAGHERGLRPGTENAAFIVGIGASAGGPVLIPKLYAGKDRTFWFFAYEALRQVNPSTMSGSVPTPAMLAGDFSGLMDSAGRQFK